MNEDIYLKFEGAFSLEEIQDISSKTINFTITEDRINHLIDLIDFSDIGLGQIEDISLILRTRIYKSKDSFIDTVTVRSNKAFLSDKPRPSLYLSLETDKGVQKQTIDINY